MEREKYIDESWKETVAQEKSEKKLGEKNSAADPKIVSQEHVSSDTEIDHAASDEPTADYTHPLQMNFLNYLTSLGFQAMIFLGEIPHPATNEYEKNLDQAKLLIDTLLMLREKTKGNLTREEENILNASVYELQTKYLGILEKEEKAS